MIHERRNLLPTYRDEKGGTSRRRIGPAAIAYGVEATLVAAWCELCNGFHQFRTGRIRRVKMLDESIPAGGAVLLRRWLERLSGEWPAAQTGTKASSIGAR